MIRRSAALVIILALATAACASGSDEATPATPSPIATNPAPTVPATDAPETTPVPTTSTTAPPPTTSTTVVPTTTLDPLAEIDAAVRQARLDLEGAYFAAASKPTDAALRDVYRSTFADGNFANREEFLERLVNEGTSLRASSTTPKTIDFPEPVEIISSQEAVIAVCRTDSDVIRIPATESSPEVIVDDRIITTLTLTRFILEEDQWVNAGAELVGEWTGANACDL
jgi:hypothetical protein